MTRSREWLLLNAVEAWLHNYQHVNTSTFTQYTELRDELHDTYIKTLERKDAGDDPEPTPPRTTRKRTNANKAAKTV